MKRRRLERTAHHEAARAGLLSLHLIHLLGKDRRTLRLQNTHARKRPAYGGA